MVVSWFFFSNSAFRRHGRWTLCSRYSSRPRLKVNHGYVLQRMYLLLFICEVNLLNRVTDKCRFSQSSKEIGKKNNFTIYRNLFFFNENSCKCRWHRRGTGRIYLKKKNMYVLLIKTIKSQALSKLKSKSNSTYN